METAEALIVGDRVPGCRAWRAVGETTEGLRQQHRCTCAVVGTAPHRIAMEA